MPHPHPHPRTRLNSANYSETSPSSSLESTEINWAQCGTSLGPGQSLEHSQGVEEDGRCPATKNSCKIGHPRDVLEGSYALYYPERSYGSHTMAAQGYTYSHASHNQRNNFQNYQISLQAQQNNLQAQQNNLINYENDLQNYKNSLEKRDNELQKASLNACMNRGSNDKGGSNGRIPFSEIGNNTQFEMDAMVPYFEPRGYHTQNQQHGYHNQTHQAHLNTENGYHTRALRNKIDEELFHHDKIEGGYDNQTLRSQMLFLASKLDSSLNSTEQQVFDKPSEDNQMQQVFNKPSEDNQVENWQMFELPSSVQVFELPLFTPPPIQNFGNSVKCWNENRVLKIKIDATSKDSI